jgi:hypothetical protein
MADFYFTSRTSNKWLSILFYLASTIIASITLVDHVTMPHCFQTAQRLRESCPLAYGERWRAAPVRCDGKEST